MSKKFLRNGLITILASMLLTAPIKSGPRGDDNQSKKPKKKNIERIVIGDFDRKYDVDGSDLLGINADRPAEWKSYINSNGDRVLDGRVDIYLSVFGINVKDVKYEFFAISDMNGFTKELVVINRAGKNTMNEYEKKLSEKFEDPEKITGVYREVFNYGRKKAYHTRGGNNVTIKDLDSTTTEFQMAYFNMLRELYEKEDNKLIPKLEPNTKKDMTFMIHYKENNYSIDVHAFRTDTSYRVGIDLRPKNAKGEAERVVSEVNGLILDIEDKTGMPTRVVVETILKDAVANYVKDDTPEKK